MTHTHNTSDGNILMAGSSIPGIMSELNLFLTKVRHPATEDALEAYLGGQGAAEDVALALEVFSYADCRNFGEHEIGSDNEVHLVMYGSASVTERAAELAAKFRREVIDRIA